MTQPDRQRRPGAAYATDRYEIVLVMLLAVLLFVTLAEESQLVRVITSLALLAVVLFTLRATGTTPRHLRALAVFTIVWAAVVVLTGFTDEEGVIVMVGAAVGAYLGYGAFALVRRIFERPRISVQEVLAAIEAYIQAALLFAFVYATIGRLEADAFFASEAAESIGNFVYFSVVTISTLGYGDLSPATDLGRSVVMIETLFGQVFLVVLIAYLVGRLGSGATASRRG
jgi:hypothetical protein